MLLREHLTEQNHDDLLREASGKSKREVLALLASRFPRPDVPSTIRKLPKTVKLDGTGEALTLNLKATSPAGDVEHSPPFEPRPAARRGHVEPLSEARYKVQFSAGTQLKDKLERAKNLLSHENPAGDLAVVVERALDLLLTELEKKKLAKTERPRPSRSVKPGAVTRAARREVFERDGQRCAFVDDQGRRCSARAFLELDHVQARALGGSGDATNLRVLCHGHNRLHAEQTFGKEHVERQINLRQRKRPAGVPKADSTQSSAGLDETYEKLFKALIRLGFRTSDARGALEQIRKGQRAVEPMASIEELLREALRLLTDGHWRVSVPGSTAGITAPPR